MASCRLSQIAADGSISAAGLDSIAVTDRTQVVINHAANVQDISYTILENESVMDQGNLEAENTTENIAVESIELVIPDRQQMKTGERKLISCRIMPRNASNKDVSWNSSDESIVSVNTEGVVTALSEGDAVITVSTEDGDYQAACRISVVKTGEGEENKGCQVKGHSWNSWKTIKQATAVETGKQKRTCSVCGAMEEKTIAKLPATIKLNMKTIPLKVKQSTTKLKVSGLAKGDKVKSYKSSNKKVAVVSSKGKITAKKKGKAKITVTLLSGKTATATVKVQTGTVKTTKLKLNTNKVTLKKGKSFTVKAGLTPLTSQQKITYKTSNKKVATVSKNGKIIARKKGKATITVKSGSKSAKIKVTVN